MERIVSVLIVEDEIEICRALADMVNSSPCFSVIYCAENGRDALNYLSKNTVPDIIMTDIRMPVMDGITLLSVLNSRWPCIKTIVISGYSDFAYAQKAIKYGVCDYILKPLNEQNCLATLESIARALTDEEKVFNLNKAIYHNGVYPPDIGRYSFLFAFCIGMYPYVINTKRSNDLTSDKNFRETIKDAYLGYKDGLYYLLPNLGTVEEARKYLKRITQLLKQRYELPATIVMDTLQHGEDLLSAANRLEKKLRATIIAFRPVSMDLTQTSYVIEQSNPYELLVIIDHELVLALGQSKYNLFQEKLFDVLNTQLAQNVPCDILHKRVMYQYVYTAQRISLSISSGNIPIPYDWENKINVAFSNSLSREQLLQEVLNIYLELFTSNASVKNQDIMREVERFIEDNYTERITNQMLAKRFGFVPSYISQRFREYNGLSPCDYLTKVRIQNACCQIQTDDHVNFCELSASLGFANSSYFSKIFKKQTGMTPSEYRSKAQSRKLLDT